MFKRFIDIWLKHFQRGCQYHCQLPVTGWWFVSINDFHYYMS